MTSQKLLSRGLVGLIGVEIGLALAYITLIWRQGNVTALLDFNGLRSLPSLLQAAHLLLIGCLSLLLLLVRHRMAHQVSWFLPLSLALLCFYGGLDEITKLHLYLDHYNWKLIYIGLLIAIPIVGWRDLVRIWCHYRSTVLWVLSGLSIFLLGGFGAEMIKGAIAAELATDPSSRILFLTEHFRIMVEEFAELLGESLILYAFAQFVVQILSDSSQTQDTLGPLR